ncbi:MAG: site-specific DNA-methyltransferase [bacterium]|nr:site-specific DNA-methyltransferase [bacterium]
MIINDLNNKNKLDDFFTSDNRYLLIHGSSKSVLSNLPDSCIDCVITSPPYWKLREYEISEKDKCEAIGSESLAEEYVARLLLIIDEIMRVLKPRGSFWLNIGDKYNNKNLMGMPWRVALAMQERKWILRNDIIWDQRKGTQSAKDRLRDVYEHIFHFVKSRKYYYNHNAIRIKPKNKATIINGRITSATGVSGVKYREQIINADSLSEDEKRNAIQALDDVLEKMRSGELVDFRMTIRGNQRTLHSNTNNVSGRAKELENKGFFFLKSQSKGYLPSDIWSIVPEDLWRKDNHYAVFPEELLKIPLMATTPEEGLVLDPFVGTGSTIAAAMKFGMRGIGIDLSDKYLRSADSRLEKLLALQTGLKL